MDWQYTLNNDPDYHRWLNMLDKIKSCAKCSYSLKLDQFDLNSPLFCYNRQCSHIGKSWTSCSDARHQEFGLCGSEAKFYKEKMLIDKS